MIQIDHVTFSYGEETEHTGGVRDIELQIKRGEFAVLCGESGCGKIFCSDMPHFKPSEHNAIIEK